MPRGGGDKNVRGGTEIFSGIKGGGGAQSSRCTEGGGGSKLFKVLIQQGPGAFTPTIVNIIDGLETHYNNNITHYPGLLLSHECCIFARLTKSNVLEKLPIHDSNNRVN